MLNVYLFGVLFVIAICYVMYKMHYPANYAIMNALCNGPSGHTPVPVVGVLVVPPSPEGVTKLVRSLSRNLGSPFYAKLGPIYACLASKAEHAEVIFAHSGNIEKGYIYKFIQPWFGNGLLTSRGSDWHKQRKLITPAFHFRILADFLPAMNEQASILCDCLKEQSEEGVSFNVVPCVTRAALDTIMNTAFGTDQGSQRQHDNAYAKAIFDFSETVLNRFAWPWLWPDCIWYLTPQGTRSKRALRVLIGFSSAVIAQKDAEYDSKVNIDTDENGLKRRVAFLDLLLDLYHKGQVTIKEVQEQVDTFMFEGHDTTAHAMQWTLWCLAANQDAQEKARQEIIQLIGDDPSVWPEYSHLPEMKWVDCCIKEALRLFPSVPLIGRTTDSPISLDGKSILPNGTLLGIDLYAIQRDPDHFDEPNEYKPERFLPENSIGRHPFAFAPFSGGQRNCIGQKYAMNEMRIVCAHILRAFVLTTEQTYTEEDSIYQLILRPKDGIWLKLKYRY